MKQYEKLIAHMTLKHIENVGLADGCCSGGGGGDGVGGSCGGRGGEGGLAGGGGNGAISFALTFSKCPLLRAFEI